MKYKLTDVTKTHFGVKLFQIEALVSFGLVKKGDKGGWIEKEENLSKERNAWVSGDALVFGNALVSGDAWVFGNAEVSGDAWVFGNAEVSGNALVSGNAWVYGNARVSGEFKLSAGFFFGWRETNQELTFIKNPDSNELIGKGDVKVEYQKDEPTEAVVKLENGKTYKVKVLEEVTN
jgi:hypothetical protein